MTDRWTACRLSYEPRGLRGKEHLNAARAGNQDLTYEIPHQDPPEGESMAYMIMLVLEQSEQLKPVLASWQALGVDEITFVESTCAHLHAPRRAHIPIRFMFESVSGEREACTLTLFAVVADEAMVHTCIDAAEAAIGDLDAAPTAMIAAWPLPIVKGYPKSKREARWPG